MFEIILNNLPLGLTEDDVLEMLKNSDVEINSIRLPKSRDGRTLGYCIAMVKKEGDAERLVRYVDGRSFRNKVMHAEISMCASGPVRSRRNIAPVDYRGMGDDRSRHDDRSFSASNRSVVYPSQFRPGIVEKVSRKNGGRCYICNRPIAPGDLSIDHVVPCAKTFNEYEYRYPQSERNDSYNDIGNLMPVHKQCNSSKGSAGAHYESRKIKSAVTPYHKTNGIGDWQKSIAERNTYKERELKKELGKYGI